MRPWGTSAATDDAILLDLDRRMVCTACGLIGADVRPDWSQRTNRSGAGAAHLRDNKPRWSADLTRPFQIQGGPLLTTLEDAGRFIAGLPECDQHRQALIRRH